MELPQNQQSDSWVDIETAIDHFLDVVYPTLFDSGCKGNKTYAKLHAFKSARSLQKQGRPNKMTNTWAIKILHLHGGSVNNRPRYNFKITAQATIEQEVTT